MKKFDYLIDDNGIELKVTYEIEKSPAFEAEPGNPNTFVQEMYMIEIDKLELFIGGNRVELHVDYNNEKLYNYLLKKINELEWQSSQEAY